MFAFILLVLSYEQAFNDYEKNDKPMLVLVSAEWCPACVTMKNTVLPRIDMPYTVVDVDKQETIARRLMKGTRLPQLILYRKGKNEKRLIGGANKTTIEQFLKD